jgi:hypothetical protein
MVDILLIALLAAGAALLNAHAAAVADRGSVRRAQLEEGWAALIAARRG